MTKLNLECPICEFVFSADSSNSVSGTIQCPHCSHSFRLTAAPTPSAPPKATRSTAPANTAPTTAPPVVPPPVAAPPIAGSPNTGVSTAASPEFENYELPQRPNTVSSDIYRRRRKANRRSNILMIILALGTIASIGLLAWRFHQMQQPPEPTPISEEVSTET